MILELDDGTPLTIGGCIQVNGLQQKMADYWWPNFEPIEDEV
jgi:hypothetical protein